METREACESTIVVWEDIGAMAAGNGGRNSPGSPVAPPPHKATFVGRIASARPISSELEPTYLIV